MERPVAQSKEEELSYFICASGHGAPDTVAVLTPAPGTYSITYNTQQLSVAYVSFHHALCVL